MGQHSRAADGKARTGARPALRRGAESVRRTATGTLSWIARTRHSHQIAPDDRQRRLRRRRAHAAGARACRASSASDAVRCGARSTCWNRKAASPGTRAAAPSSRPTAGEAKTTAGRRADVGGDLPAAPNWRSNTSSSTSIRWKSSKCGWRSSRSIARLAAFRASQAEINRLQALAEETRTASDPATYERANSRFHRTIAEAARNALFLAIFDTLHASQRDVGWRRLGENAHCYKRQSVYAGYHQEIWRRDRRPPRRSRPGADASTSERRAEPHPSTRFPWDGSQAVAGRDTAANLLRRL